MQNLERGEKRMFRIAICDDEKIFRDDLKEINCPLCQGHFELV